MVWEREEKFDVFFSRLLPSFEKKLKRWSFFSESLFDFFGELLYSFFRLVCTSFVDGLGVWFLMHMEE